MSADRPLFDEAVDDFRAFLRRQGKTDRLLWISRERVTGWRTSFWVFRPEQLQSDATNREFYDALRPTKTSMGINTLGELAAGTMAYVENYGGNGGHLNYGIPTGSRQIHAVSSRLIWWIARLISRLFGESPLLRNIRISKKSESVDIRSEGTPPRHA